MNKETSVEQWKPAQLKGKSFPSYLVSNKGRVKYVRSGKLVSRYENVRNYYYFVNLYDRETYLRTGGRKTVFSVSLHRLVAETWLGARPRGFQVDHIDGDKHNNDVSNLQYITQSENIQKSYAAGRKSTGREKFLSPETYKRIRDLWESGFYSQLSLGKAFGLCNSTVSKIVNNKQKVRRRLDAQYLDLLPDEELLKQLRRDSPVKPGTWTYR